MLPHVIQNKKKVVLSHRIHLFLPNADSFLTNYNLWIIHENCQAWYFTLLLNVGKVSLTILTQFSLLKTFPSFQTPCHPSRRPWPSEKRDPLKLKINCSSLPAIIRDYYVLAHANTPHGKAEMRSNRMQMKRLILNLTCVFARLEK